MPAPIITVTGTSIYFLDYFAPVLSRLWRARMTATAFVVCWFLLLAIIGLLLLWGPGGTRLGPRSE